MFDLDVVAVDPHLSAEGKWMKFMGGEFLIARWNNRKAEALRQEMHMEFYKELSEMEDGKMPEGLEKRFDTVQARIMSEAILLGWKGVGKAGELIEYSSEAAFEILNDPKFLDLVQFIQNSSINRENYSVANTEKVIKDVKASADS